MDQDDIIAKAANGNRDAARFLSVLIEFAHHLDDLIDRDKPVTDAILMECVMAWTMEVSSNPFVQANRASLIPLLLVSVNAWLDANEWAKSKDENLVRSADTLKGMYHEIFYYVAYLTGGWKSMRALSSTAREYDYEPLKN